MFDVNDIRKDFPMIVNNQDLVYFDSSATSFKPKCVIDKVLEYYETMNSNIHRGDYDISYKVSKIYDDTRKTIANFLNADNPSSIVFTNGATHSLNTIAFSYGLNELKKGDVILTTLVEHAANILPWYKVAEKTGAVIKYIKLNDDATFNMDNYIKCFENNDVKIVNITHISNVMGYVYPIKDICKIAHQYGALVNVDGAQSVPHIKVDVKDLDVDFLSFSSHKMCGPAGVGVLYGKYELLQSLNPFMYGGDSNARFDLDGNIILKQAPEKFESGTPNIEGVLGLNEAIKYIQKLGIENIENHVKELNKYFIDKLSKIDNVIIYNKNSESGIITFNIKGIFAQDVSSYLNKYGFALRSGTHCAKNLHNIIGINETIRASLYMYNTKEEIDKFIDVVKDITIEKCVDSLL